MKVLYVNHYPVYGGPLNLARRMAKPLKRLTGLHTTIAIPTGPGNAADWLEGESDLELVRLPLHRLRASVDPRLHLGLLRSLPAEVATLRRLIRERQIAVVVLSGLLNPHAAIAARLEGAAVVWQIVDRLSPAIVRRTFAPVVDQLAHALMFNGQPLIPLHFGRRTPRTRSFVFASPVDTATFDHSAASGKSCRRELGIPDGAPVIGTVANLHPAKCAEDFVRCASIVYRARPDAWFVLCGSSHATHQGYRAFLEEEMHRSGVPGERFVTTSVPPDRLPGIYSMLNVKLVTSCSEGTTTTAMEAMACRVPVVATNVGSLDEVVDDGLTGYVVPPRAPTALAMATLRLLADRELATTLGETARVSAIARYDVDVCARVCLDAFQAAHAANRRTPPDRLRPC